MEAIGISTYEGMPLYLDDGSSYNWTGGGVYARFGTTPYAQGARGNSKWASGGVELGDDLNFWLGLLAGGSSLIRAKLERHVAYHTFGKLGKRKHYQLTIWLKGIKNSHINLRLPLPK